MRTRFLRGGQSRFVFASLSMLALGMTVPAHAQDSNDPSGRLTEAPHFAASRPSDDDQRATLTNEQWTEFGNRVAEALASENDGVRQGAVRLVIKYGPALQLKRSAIFDLVRVYRDHDNARVRRMAVVALAETEDEWALDLLRRSVRYEKEPAVRHTLAAVLAPRKEGIIEVELPERVATR